MLVAASAAGRPLLAPSRLQLLVSVGAAAPNATRTSRDRVIAVGAAERDKLEKAQNDCFHLQRHTLRLNLRIVARTLRDVAGGRGR